MIHVTITKSGVELITDRHKRLFPSQSHNNERAYDWIVFSEDENGFRTIGSGRCEWQGCGYVDYAEDLPVNLIAGMTAYEIRNRYDEFIRDPFNFLKSLKSDVEYDLTKYYD